MILYCKCGCPIWIDVVWNSIRYVYVFSNHENKIEITHCPDCGDLLIKERLEYKVEC